MAYTDQKKIALEKSQPRIVALWQALQPLKTCVSFMNSGAHPDDETSAMMVCLNYQHGLDLSYACANRGEGGQNDIGIQSEQSLGALRTAEMERASQALNMRLYWLSETPTDDIFDFGFSKSGEETLSRWGLERTLQRFVEIIRQEKPDILCTTFLDVAGQHGHHRAMTQAAQQVMSLAADASYTCKDLPPWQVSKLYLPGWSGAGQAYDDATPPPPAHITIAGKGHDPITGWSYERFGQQSRAYHRTQGMGHWVAAGQERDWPLHMAQGFVDNAEATLLSGLAVKLTDFKAPKIQQHLDSAQASIDHCIAAFPNSFEMLEHASSALQAIQKCIEHCPSQSKADLEHRLVRKEQQLSRIIYLASECDVHAYIDESSAQIGDQLKLHIEQKSTADLIHLSPQLPDGWQLDDHKITLDSSSQIEDPYPCSYDPLSPRKPYITVQLNTFGVESYCAIALAHQPVILPSYRLSIANTDFVINNTTAQRSINIDLQDITPNNGKLSVDAPDEWDCKISQGKLALELPQQIACGLYQIPIKIDGCAAYCVEDIDYPHIAHTALCKLAIINVRVIEVALVDAKVAYIGAGNDRVDHWLRQMGVSVTQLSEADFQQPDSLNGIDTLVFGIMTLRIRQALIEQLPQIHQWVKAGGNWLTLYHRPWDNWDPQHTAVLPLEIGQPSLRWRVTDQNATVSHCLPQHCLLNYPNKIDQSQWDNWQKERGLYFAKSWHPDYQALISMHDPDEQPLTGSLLSADIDQGRHTHCTLILHHQMQKLVPGAFTIMANLIAPVKRSI